VALLRVAVMLRSRGAVVTTDIIILWNNSILPQRPPGASCTKG
jgi:hypothetical protein